MSSLTCEDATILKLRAPRGVKRKNNACRAMMFRAYPRQAVLVHTRAQLEAVEYLYTRAWTNDPRGLVLDETGGLAEVWINGDYTPQHVGIQRE